MNDFIAMGVLIALGMVVVCIVMAFYEWIDRELSRK